MPASYGRYDIGDLVKLVATLVSTDLVTPGDASYITYYVRSPNGSLATHVFTAGAGGSITRVATGAYRKDVTPDAYGVWKWGVVATGGVQAAEKWSFTVDEFI